MIFRMVKEYSIQVLWTQPLCFSEVRLCVYQVTELRACPGCQACLPSRGHKCPWDETWSQGITLCVLSHYNPCLLHGEWKQTSWLLSIHLVEFSSSGYNKLYTQFYAQEETECLPYPHWSHPPPKLSECKSGFGVLSQDCHYITDAMLIRNEPQKVTSTKTFLSPIL